MSHRCAIFEHRFKRSVCQIALLGCLWSAEALASPDTSSAPATTQAATRPGASESLWTLPRSGQSSAIPAQPDVGTGRLMLQMLMYVLIILVLGAIALFAFRRVIPRIRRTPGAQVSILETVYLGPRQAVYLLRVGSGKILVAGTRDRVSMLVDVTERCTDGPLPPAADQGQLEPRKADPPQVIGKTEVKP